MTGREVLRDKFGVFIGEIRIEGSKQTLWDKHFNRLGEYDRTFRLDAGQIRKPRGPRQFLVTLLK